MCVQAKATEMASEPEMQYVLMGLEWPIDCAQNSAKMERFFDELTHRYMMEYDSLELEAGGEDPKRVHGDEARER